MSLADELAKLEELRRSGALTEAEFTQAKATLIRGAPAVSEQQLGNHLANQLAEVKHQNELTQIDREWEMERQQYLIQGQDGISHVPTAGMGIGAAVVGGIFGVFWIIMALAITSDTSGFGEFAVARVFFPLFGVVFTLGAIGYGIYTYSRAQKYDEAFAAYKARRARVKPEAEAQPDQSREERFYER